jgi:hypothetical protein
MTIAATLQHLARRSPASERNRGPILERLLQLLPPSGNALEIASGTGQHVAFFAARMPQWVWQPSDCTDEAFASIDAWCAQEGAPKVHAPVLLDATAPRWPADGPAFGPASQVLVLCINMLHIAPWAACAGLMQGAARCLAPDGRLVTYGPYTEADVTTAPSNLAFDADLRQRNPAWGLRALGDVQAQAEAAGLRLAERHPMPANNLLLVFQRG